MNRGTGRPALAFATALRGQLPLAVLLITRLRASAPARMAGTGRGSSVPYISSAWRIR